MSSCIGIQKANENFISLCKKSNDTINVDYIDSSHGIVSIDHEVKKDTLFLKVNVGLFRNQKIFQIKLGQTIRFINTGIKTYNFDEIIICPKIYKGEEGIEYLKSQRKE